MTRQFTCAGCGKTFNTTTTEAQKEAEFVEVYKHASCGADEELVSTCDVCFEVVKAYIEGNN